MPIICFEGASAVGKTTTSNALRDERGARVVPEVNQLFARPENEPAEWYFERQVERWRIARERSRRGALVVLDGDPFQPL
ncbi:MAG TPA: AAA family ATPase [Pyrinomonadaceae bacterium]|jgi:deoxyadenosine/deoxycytidine kinase